MQVKKFEAPTLQEALDTIKRELGPEAIILQTKQNRRGFGLMSKGSVEVTAAVSERALGKKNNVEKRLPDAYTQKVNSMSASKQVDLYESYLEKRIEKEKVEISSTANAKKKTAVRYADILDEGNHQPVEESIPSYSVPPRIENAIENFSSLRNETSGAVREEIENLKRLVEELRNTVSHQQNKPDFLESDSPYSATEALQEAYEVLLHSGVEKRFAVQIMRETSRNLGVEARADRDAVLDSVADLLLRQTHITPFFENQTNPTQVIHAFIGASGVGKTTVLAKLATHSARQRNEKMGVIRVQLNQDEGADTLNVFAKALHVPYRVVTSAEELQVAIQDMSQCNRIFIDTPSVSHRESGTLTRLGNILDVNTAIRRHLVVSSTTRDFEAREQAKFYSRLNPENLVFTRVDETFSFGSIYSVSSRLNLPVSIFSTGKKVTGEWERATAERLTASILNIV